MQPAQAGKMPAAPVQAGCLRSQHSPRFSLLPRFGLDIVSKTSMMALEKGRRSLFRFVCCFALLLVVASAAALAQEDPDLARIFADRGATGTIVMRSLDGSVAYVHNQSRAKEPFIPASTFKIPTSLIALEEKAIADENEVIKWDGRK